MRVVITGAAGFIGQTLASALLEVGHLVDERNLPTAITELVLADKVLVEGISEKNSYPNIKITTKAGDLENPKFIDELMGLGDVQCIFHLAASLTFDAEKNDEQAYQVNVEAIRKIIDKASNSTRLIFASSIAVFGGEIPAVVTDELRAEPETTYGTHKAITELLLADASRKGNIDARSLRLPIVLIRPGATSPTISDRIAAIVREPLSGRDVVCGISPNTRMPVASAQAVAKALIKLQAVSAERLPKSRVMNLPSLTVSVDEMESATIRQAKNISRGKIRFDPDKNLQNIIDGWPKVFASKVATELGIVSDSSFDEIIEKYLISMK